MRSLRLFAGAATLGSLAGNVLAQDIAPPALDPVMLGQGLVLSSMMHAHAERDAARLRRQGRLPVVTQAAASTRFKPSLARRKAQAQRFMAATKRLSPEIAQSLPPAFQNDPVRYVAPYITRYGVRADDVADLTALYLVGSWYGAHGKTNDPTKGEVTAVRDQLRRAYLASPRLRTASDAAKQNVAEGSFCLALFNDVLLETMKAHPEAKPRLMAEIAGGAKAAFGLDLRSMRITKAGLVN